MVHTLVSRCNLKQIPCVLKVHGFCCKTFFVTWVVIVSDDKYKLKLINHCPWKKWACAWNSESYIIPPRHHRYGQGLAHSYHVHPLFTIWCPHFEHLLSCDQLWFVIISLFVSWPSIALPPCISENVILCIVTRLHELHMYVCILTVQCLLYQYLTARWLSVTIFNLTTKCQSICSWNVLVGRNHQDTLRGIHPRRLEIIHRNRTTDGL